MQAFVRWYNTEDCHSAIRFVTPEVRYRGDDRHQLAQRDRLYQGARDRHPTRWSGRTRNWRPIGSVWIKPERPENHTEGHGGAAALPHRAGGGGSMADTTDHAA